MKTKHFAYFLSIAFILAGFIQDKDLNEIIEDGAQLEKLADGFLFTEGPTSDNEGNVYFTDQPNDRIMVWKSTESGLRHLCNPAADQTDYLSTEKAIYGLVLMKRMNSG